MLLHIPKVLSPESLHRCREIILGGDWADGRITAGTQSGQVKRNQQLPEDSPAAREAQRLILAAIGNNGLFLSGALPQRVFPPLFNRYATGMDFGNHIDNAVRTHVATGQHIRTDISCTLFLAEPYEYDGGELVIEDIFGSQAVKLAAGDMILYPASSVHRVTPVTRGARVASFFWIESMVRDAEKRRLLFDMDMSILDLRQSQGESEAAVRLTGCYHNLLRMWAGG
ncbi:MAG: Fe2+-dependent dioxygenase [Betaproteobacteria bacterium]